MIQAFQLLTETYFVDNGQRKEKQSRCEFELFCALLIFFFNNGRKNSNSSNGQEIDVCVHTVSVLNRGKLGRMWKM